MKKVIKMTGIVVALVVLAAATFAFVLIGPRNVWGMLRYDQRKEGKLATGERAPDVSLTALDGVTRARLLERAGKQPLVLIFGSYT